MGWSRVVAVGGRELTDDPGPDTTFTFTVFFQWPLWTRRHLRLWWMTYISALYFSNT
jgi:hypothetical protein